MIEQLKPFAEVKDNSASLDIDNYEYLDDVKYDNVIFDLRNIEDKLNNRDTWITIRGKRNCNHEQVEHGTGICTKCGAYHYPLGAEPYSTDFYKHIYYIAQKIEADSVMFISERYFPQDFTLELFGTYKTENKYKRVISKMLISGFGKHWSLKKTRFDNLYIIIFTNSIKDDTDDFLVSNDFEFQINNIIDKMKGTKLYYDKLDSEGYYSANMKYTSFDKKFLDSKKKTIRSIF